PAASGIRPPLSSIRPALISRSAILCIASSRAGVGATGWADVTMNMNFICAFLVRRAAGDHHSLDCLAIKSTKQPTSDRHALYVQHSPGVHSWINGFVGDSNA